MMQKGVNTTEEEVQENETDVYGIIEWWNNLPEDFVDTKTLIHKRRKLAAMYVMITKFRKEQKKIYHKKQLSYDLKIKKFSVKKQSEVKEGTEKHFSQATSNELAKIQHEAESVELAELEGTIEGVDSLMWAIKDILTAMLQEIAVFRGIKEDADQTAGDNYSTNQQRTNVQ